MNAMQAMGSASTYSRRYAIQVALGIAPITEEQAAKLQAELKTNDVPMPRFSDDDGAASSGSTLSLLKNRLLAFSPQFKSNLALGRILRRHNLTTVNEIRNCTDEDRLASVLEQFEASKNGANRAPSEHGPRH